MKPSNDDIQWIAAHYPRLFSSPDRPEVIAGTLLVDMIYDRERKEYIIKPDEALRVQRDRIKDEYEIEIDFRNVDEHTIPVVLETGGRIVRLARDRDMSVADLHFNANGHACLCFELEKFQRLPNGFNAEDFFHKLLIPFFYCQSYFEKFHEWPWGQYSHGTTGLLEWYGDNEKTTSVERVRETLSYLRQSDNKELYDKILGGRGNIKGHHACICGSHNRFRKCHPSAFQGLWRLRQDLKTFHIDVAMGFN